QFLAKTIDEVNFGIDGQLSASWRRLDGFAAALCRADLIGGLGNLQTALGVNDDANAGMLAADALNLLRREALMNRAIALPEDNARVANRFRRVSAKILVGIPDDHLVKRDAHAIPGVAAKVLVWKEENFLASFEGPVHDSRGVGAGANRAAVLAGEGFDGCSRVHVGDRDDLAHIEER